MKRNRNAIAFIFWLLSALSAGAQEFYTVGSYTWYNKAEVTVGFVATAAGVTSADITIGNLTVTPSTRYVLTYPDGTSDEIKPGMYFFTEETATSGYTIQFRQSGSNYLLTVDRNGGDNLETTACFYLTISGIGNSSSNAVTASASPGCGIIPYGNHWQGNNVLADISAGERDVNILFTVNGANCNIDTKLAHKVIIGIRSTVALTTTFDLRGFTYGPTSSNSVDVTFTNCDAATDNAIDTDRNGTDISWRTTGGQYTLILEANESCGPMDDPSLCDFSHDETWQLTLKEAAGALGAGIDVSIVVRDKDGNVISASETNGTVDPVSLVHPPLAVITGPVNQPAAVTFPVMRERTYNLMPQTSSGTETLKWFATTAVPGGLPFPNPEAITLTSDSLSSLAQKRYFLKSKQAVAAPGPQFTSFTHFSFDVLTVESKGKEYAAFPRATGVPYDEEREPYVDDGIVEGNDGRGSDAEKIYGENGWKGAFRVTHEDGAIPEDVAFQAIRSIDGNTLYMSFEVKSDTDLEDTDVIVVGIRPDSTITTSSNDRMLRIYPGSKTIHYYRDSAAWQEYTPTISSGFKVGTLDETGANSRWSVEIRIPAQAQGSEWPQIQGSFLLYYDVLRTYAEVSGEYVVSQFSWPRFAPRVRGNIDTFQFSPAWWGEAKKADPLTTNGVSISSSDIGVIPAAGDLSTAPTNVMTTDTSRINTFVARVRNTTTQEKDDGAGGVIVSPKEVSGVNVTFRIANWGVPSLSAQYWSIILANVAPYNQNPVPAQTSPTPGDSVIEGNTYGQYEAQWQLTGDQRNLYVTDWGPTVNELHQCIHVLVDAPSGNVNFLNKSVVRNMNFDGASKFSQVACIDSRGYGPPPFGWKDQRFLLFINQQRLDEGADLKGQMAAFMSARGKQKSGATSSYFIWSAHATRYTGDVVIINGVPHKAVDPVGSFGHVMEHKGEVRDWNNSLEGTTAISDRLRRIDVPPESVAKAKTVIEAVEPIGLSLSLHVGAATPVPPSSFANDYSTGFCVIGDIGYRLPDRVSMIGLLFGYNGFPAKSAGDDDSSIMNIALNYKYFLPIGRNMQFGIGAGLELFIQDFSTLNSGYDLDLSYDIGISRVLGFEIGVICHSQFNQKVWFIQSHAGLILRL